MQRPVHITGPGKAAILAALALGGAFSVSGGIATAQSNGQEARETRTSANPHGYTQERNGRASTNEFIGGAWARLRASRGRRAGYGWTNAHQKRVARKARNVRRHRAAKKA